MADAANPGLGGTPASGTSKGPSRKWDRNADGVPDVLEDADKRKELMRKYGYTEADLRSRASRELFYEAVRKDYTRKEAREAYDAVYVNDRASVRDIVEESGFTMELVRLYPELRDVFRRLSDMLARGKITESNLYDTFRDLISKTDFGKRTDSEISADLDRYGRNNRKNWKQRVSLLSDSVIEFYLNETGGVLDQATADEISIELIYGGQEQSATALQRRVRQYIKDSRQPEDEGSGTGTGDAEAGDDYTPGGQRGRVQVALANWFSANGLIVSRTQLDKYVDDIMDGASTEEELKQWYRDNRLAVTYAGYADDFARGMDASDIAMDFRGVMANLLERNLEDIDFDDPLVQRAMQRRGEDGKAMPMTRYEFEQEVRSTDEWQKTDNAMTTYTNIGEDLLRTFGFRG